MLVDNSKLQDFKNRRFKSLLFVVFLILVIVGSIFTIKNSIIKPADQTIKLFDYKLNNDIKYQVNLLPNNFYEERYLGMGKLYSSDLIDIIEIDFENTLKLNKVAIIDYDYVIKAEIYGTYTSDKSNKVTEIWTKDFTLLPREKETKNNNKNNEITKKIELDFSYYNDIVKQYKQELKLNIDAVLNITMTINYNLKIEKEEVRAKQELNMTLPLNKVAFEIETKIPEPTSEVVYSSGDLIIQYPFLILAVGFLIVALVLIVIFVKHIIKLNKKTEYTVKLNKILKTYGEIIAESKTPPNCSKYDVLDIANFEDLVDIENEVRIPIIYYEKIQDTEGWFTLVHGNQMYCYILYIKEDKNLEK